MNDKIKNKQEENAVKQAIKDDQALAPVAADIKVTVNDGTVTLEGQVTTAQQMNIATNTAKALSTAGKVNTLIEVTQLGKLIADSAKKKAAKANSKADDDGFAV